VDDEVEDLYPEGPILEPDQRPFIERAAAFFLQYGFALFIVALVIVLGLAVWFGPTPPEVTQANFEVIQVGMKEADIATLLKGQSTGRPRLPPREEFDIVDGQKVVYVVDWQEWSDGVGGRIIVGFVNGRVWHKATEGSLKPR